MQKMSLQWTTMTLALLAAVTVVSGQSPQTTAPPTPPSQSTPQTPKPGPAATPNPQSQESPIFKATTNYVYNDFKVVDAKGQFVPGLKPEDFKILEDGVEQKMQFFQEVAGGRVFSTPITLNAAPPKTGLIVPTSRPPVDSSGRIIVVFIDDLHLQVGDTPIAKRVLEIMRDTLLHDGDEITIVGTGYSGIEGYPLMYYYQHNHQRLDEAINKLYGSGMSPEETVNASQTEQGPAGLRYNMDTAFRTAYDLLAQMEKITNRRKAFIYVSSGYDLDPFKDARLQAQENGYNHLSRPGDSYTDSAPMSPGATSNPPSLNDIINNPFGSQIGEFSETDLFRELAELIRAAKRADTVFYTVDPRGLVPPLPPGMIALTPTEWQDFIIMTTSTLQALAEQTGGMAAVNTNDFKTFFKKVDNDFSDYYEMGYTSSDIDPLRRSRQIQIKTVDPALKVLQTRDSYQLKSAGDAIDKPKPPKPKRGGGGGGGGGRPPL